MRMSSPFVLSFCTLILATHGMSQVSLAPSVSIPASGIAAEVCAADMDGDGDDDLVLRRQYGVSVMLNQGGMFGPAQIFWASPLPTRSFAVGDLNGDGYPDVLLGASSPAQGMDASIKVLLNDALGGLLPPTSFPFPTPNDEAPEHLALGDLNNDGALDVSVATRYRSLIKVYLNDGNGGLFAGQSFAAFWCESSAVRDMDGDGDNDIVAAEGLYGFRIHLNNGFGGFTPGAGIQVADFSATNADGPFEIAVTDFDGDGILDVAGGGENSTTQFIAVALGTGGGVFAPAVVHPAPLGGKDLGAADLNGDGLPELISNRLADALVVHENLGSNSFSLLPYVGVGATPGCPAFIDIDGDSDLDLFIPCPGDEVVSKIINNSMPSGLILTYPGTNDDLTLLSGVGTNLNGGPGNDVKTVMSNDSFSVSTASPSGSLSLQPLFLVASLFPTGTPPTNPPGLASIHVDLANYFFLLGAPTNPLVSLLSPVGNGLTLFVPPGLSGQSAIVQSVVSSAVASNGSFAASEAHEIQVQ